MIIKINNDTEYDFVEAKRENGQIVGTLTDGSEVILCGDIPGIDELFLNNRPLDEIRADKLAELSASCNASITAGMDVETTQGTEHFFL